MNVSETPAQALERIQSMMPSNNDTIVISGFTARGISSEDISPRENVLTYKAWQGMGRQVIRGEKSVRVPIVGKYERVNTETGVMESKSYKKMACVFHISQTEEIR